MEENNDNLLSGGFIVSRSIFESEIFTDKPDKWLKIWIYLLGTANHETKSDRDGYRRGEHHTSYEDIQRATGSTRAHVEKTIKYLKQATMIATTKTTRGFNYIVLKYDTYQTLDNYGKRHQKRQDKRQPSDSEATAERQAGDTINKNRRMKELKNTNAEVAQEFIKTWNDAYGTAFTSIAAIQGNIEYWLKEYTPEQLMTAVRRIKDHEYWKDKMRPDTLLRRKNPRGDSVDYIGEMLNIKTKEKEQFYA